MKCRGLRVAWSIAWGVVALLLCVLWVRSYWRVDELRLRAGRAYLIISAAGEAEVEVIGFSRQDALVEYSWDQLDAAQLEYRRHRINHNTIFGFGYETDPDPSLGIYNILAPLWFLASAAIACAVLPWLCWLPRRFSVRTLLMATALVAGLLGLVAWSVR